MWSREEVQDWAWQAGAGLDHPQLPQVVIRVPKLPTPPLTEAVHCRATLAYLTHLFMEVFLQTRDALERVDIETYTAARGRGYGEDHTHCVLHPQRHRALK